MSRAPYRAVATDLLNEMERDPEIDIAPLTEDLFQSALQLFRGRTESLGGSGFTAFYGLKVLVEAGFSQLAYAESGSALLDPTSAPVT